MFSVAPTLGKSSQICAPCRSPASGTIGPFYQKFGVTTNGVRHSWAIFILPHIEQSNLYAQYNLNADWASNWAT